MVMTIMMMNYFCGMVDRRKASTTYFQPGPLSEILTIANLRHAASRISTCSESKFRLCWMKLCNIDNKYTTGPPTLTEFERVNWFLFPLKSSENHRFPMISGIIIIEVKISSLNIGSEIWGWDPKSVNLEYWFSSMGIFLKSLRDCLQMSVLILSEVLNYSPWNHQKVVIFSEFDRINQLLSSLEIIRKPIILAGKEGS